VQASQKKHGPGFHQATLNLIREYLQVLILKAIYQSKHGKGLSFVGGTCLCICHDLKRYSEDLDFNLDKNFTGYSFPDLNRVVASFLKTMDFETDIQVSADKTVQKSFIRVSRVLHLFGLSPLQSQKIHVKLEVDTRQPKVKERDIETWFVTKFDEVFPIRKHTDSTLFADKLNAILSRPFAKGRDYYDLIWYLNHHVPVNFDFLNRALAQFHHKDRYTDPRTLFAAVMARAKAVDADAIIKDIGPFLSEPGEKVWLKDYSAVLKQAVAQYIG
jgi:predicted nucleotidyltransferase component of viral defense system